MVVWKNIFKKHGLTYAIVQCNVLKLKDSGRTQAGSFHVFVMNFCADLTSK